MAMQVFRFVTLLLAMMAAISLGTAVADLLVTAISVCGSDSGRCPATTDTSDRSDAIILSWVSSGIWGSLATFVVGILGMKLPLNPNKNFALFATVTFLTAVIILPAMIVISIIEAYLVNKSSIYDVETQKGHAAKFILPVIVAILGSVEFFMVAGILMYTCLTTRVKPAEADLPSVVPPVVQPPQPQPLPAPTNPSQDLLYPYARPTPLPEISGQIPPGYGYYYPSRIYQLQPSPPPAVLRPVPLSYVPMSTPAAGWYDRYRGDSLAAGGAPVRTYGIRYAH